MYLTLVDVSTLGPVVFAQVIPETPVTVHVGVPVGNCPPVGPVTVAVNVKVEPKAAFGSLVETVTVGAALAIFKLKAVEGPAAL